MTMRHGVRRHQGPVAVLLSVLALAVAACGTSTTTVDQAGSPAVDGGSEGLPALTVTDLEDDSAVSLTDYTPVDKPLLVWFWAPH